MFLDQRATPIWKQNGVTNGDVGTPVMMLSFGSCDLALQTLGFENILLVGINDDPK
jgi:hypothetical protein